MVLQKKTVQERAKQHYETLLTSIFREKAISIFGPAVCIVVLVFIWLLRAAVRQHEYRHDVNSGLTSHYLATLWRPATDHDVRIYNITWYEIPFDISYWDDAVHSGFDACQYSNCRMLFGADHVNYSDAVIIDGRLVKPEYFFKRRPGQIWIFSAHEAPVSFNDTGAHWTRGGWVSGYNWTMTYDRSNTDIYLPYGEFRKKTDKPEKDYSRIFKMKNKTALIVHSHCPSRSRRETFVNKLSKYMDVDSYGFCGKPWNCGGRFRHELDNCFERINGYKYYLAFENAFCNQYFTEKLFRNFNYDSIMVIRGGRNNDAKRLFPNGTFISTEDFKSIKKLADYLTKLAASEERYTEMLKQKDKYYSVPYKTVYQRAMCEICERLNNQDKYRKHIKSTIQWAFGKEQCEKPTDLNET